MKYSHVDRPLVYVAGPYQHPDPVENTHDTILVADFLNETEAVTAFVPHLTLLWHIVAPHEADYWYDYDLAILARCDALLRIPGKSSGADKEEEFANDHDIPVFHDADSLLSWVANVAQ